MISGDIYALLAGILGAVASSSAKLSLGADYLKDMCDTGMKRWTTEDHWSRHAEEETPCDWVTHTSCAFYTYGPYRLLTHNISSMGATLVF